MCRNIKPLFNFDPPATSDEIDASALQFVRKVTGMPKPSEANRAVFEAAVADISATTMALMDQLVTKAVPRDREQEKQKAIERGKKRDEQTRRRLLAEAE